MGEAKLKGSLKDLLKMLDLTAKKGAFEHFSLDSRSRVS